MTRNYDLLLQVLKNWPVDPSKSTRCYGFYLRELSRKGFPSGNIFPGDEASNYLILSSLLRLSKNKYGELWPYRKNHGGSGFNLETIKCRLSDRFIDEYCNRPEE